MIKKKVVPAPEPTLEERAATAAFAADVALSIFQSAADSLDAAANELDAVRDEAHDEAMRHLSIKVDADEAATKNRQQAVKIRELIGG